MHSTNNTFVDICMSSEMLKERQFNSQLEKIIVRLKQFQQVI